MMKLIHYTSKKIDIDLHRKYVDVENVAMKPSGLWVSVQGEDDWKWWCESEEFRLDGLNYAYEVKLKENANVLHLKTPFSLLEFTKKYGSDMHGNPLDLHKYFEFDGFSSGWGVGIINMDWAKAKKEYQGIIIAPYQWSCRFDLMWYYGWDCASGCIWDLECIEEVKLINDDSEESVEAV